MQIISLFRVFHTFHAPTEHCVEGGNHDTFVKEGDMHKVDFSKFA